MFEVRLRGLYLRSILLQVYFDLKPFSIDYQHNYSLNIKHETLSYRK